MEIKLSFETELSQILPAYEIPDDDIVGEVLIPAMKHCEELKIGTGFFSSRCLAQIAPGLAAFINETSIPLQLLASPEISAEDREAIRQGVSNPEQVIENSLVKLFKQAAISHSAIERHTVNTLSYLVASRRLDMRVALMNSGMYHKKIWLMRSGENWLAVHGSANATERGLLANGEQMSVDRTWSDGERATERVAIFKERWNKQWENKLPDILTIQIHKALNYLRDRRVPEPPTIADFWQAWKQDHEAGLEPEPPPANFKIYQNSLRLKIPEKLVWREGRFAHQGIAVDSLMENNGGILSIATGGGKTCTALIAAAKFQKQIKHLCVVILVPSRPLLRQWSKDVRKFGIEPVNLSGNSPKQRRLQELERMEHSFTSTRPRTECILMTNALFKSNSEERKWLERIAERLHLLLIADEMHNLGSNSFINNQPDFFGIRIGLSATPIRQYDPDGTDRLFDFFGGPPVFEFSIRNAIESKCLVPYRYHLRIVRLSEDEMEYYEELSEQLARAGFHMDDEGRSIGLTPYVESLLRKRRALIEQADAKIEALERELLRIGVQNIEKTLIYASAKPIPLPDKERQITAVNRLLSRIGIVSHQYTAKETGKTKTTEDFLTLFGRQDYQVLTAMKVLDEGIDLPQTNTAFLLASSTVEREWVQRRGRILRNAPEKATADLYDFIVIPPGFSSDVSQSLLRSELRRANSFADVAENEYDTGGPNEIISYLENQI